MDRVVLAAIALALAAPTALGLGLLAGVPNADAPPAGSDATIVDPQGDAYDVGPRSSYMAGMRACQLAGRGPQCASTVNGASAALPDDAVMEAGGTPASPAMDLVAVRFTDTPTTIEVAFEVASLGSTYDDAFPYDGRQPMFFLCWESFESSCYQSVQAYIKRTPEGDAVVEADVGEHLDCNAWRWCNWGVDGRYEPGSPGRIVVEVPRALLAEPDIARLTGMVALSGYYDWRFTDVVTAYGVEAAGQAEANAHGGTYNVADWAGEGSEEYLLATPRAPVPIATSAWTPSARGLHSGVQDDRMDILGVGLYDNETTLTVEMRLATIISSTEHLWIDLYLGAPDGTMVYVGTDSSHPEDVYAITCPMPSETCAENERNVVVNVEWIPGTPGSVLYHIARADMGRPAAGDMLTLLAGDTGIYDLRRFEAGSAPVAAYTTARNSTDWFGYGKPWRFTVDSAQPMGTTTTLPDPSGDTVVPLGMLGSADAYDIISLRSSGAGPGLSRITLDLADLSSVIVPQGYSGVLYAAAVETDAGAFMAGYYKSGANADGGEFFCAPDVDVFTQTHRDPTEVVWQPITGIVTLARSAQGGQGSGSSGSITFNLPSSCLGDPDAETIAGKRIGAGTYLVNAATGEVSEVDSVRGDEPIALGVATPPPPAAAWWASPFWLLVAVAATGSGGLLALFARQRRRRALDRELRAIDEAHARHRGDAAAWKRAMTERRTHAAELLRGARLRSDEVLVIERRVELLSADVVVAAKPSAMLAPGALLLERYELLRVLGEGSQGRAFLARDRTLQRDVVVKSVRTLGLDGNARRALLAEARLAGGIGHPNVVRVHDVRDEGTEALLILEYVEGGSLRDLLARRARLPVSDAVAIARGVLQGLQAAHERGIVHRDVKPENVLIARDGAPMLADFGAARDVRRDATFVPQGVGTLTYMSPEQVRSAHVDARSDLYSVGAMLVEMLTGAPYLPLAQVDQFQARAMILEKAPDVRFPEGALPLTGVALRALAKNPSERYQSAVEMLAALDAATP